jgi:uncharacterized protein
MSKYLLIIGIALGVYWLWRQGRMAESREARPAPPAPPAAANKSAINPPQDMVACAHCGLHLPRSEALADGPGGSEPFYCSAAHRQSGRQA